MRTRSGPLMALAAIGMELAVASATAEDKETGFLTDRLSAKQLRMWRSIENIVNAPDEQGRPLHPILQGLWQRIAAGNHAVHIEIFSPAHISTYPAGKFEVGSCDPDRKRCNAVLRLCPPVIAGAALTNEGRLTDEFIPFRGLGTQERYAEVLGHELAHAVRMLEDPHYAAVSMELEKQGEELSQFLRRKGKGELYKQELQARIALLRSLAYEIEKPAEEAEVEIWRELREGQSVRFSARR